jgi:hypothetical protein
VERDEREVFFFLRLRMIANEGARDRSRDDRALVSAGDVNALESVRGRKKPSLPRGMLSPWTTCKRVSMSALIDY